MICKAIFLAYKRGLAGSKASLWLKAEKIGALIYAEVGGRPKKIIEKSFVKNKRNIHS